jgi:hypothetical protein
MMLLAAGAVLALGTALTAHDPAGASGQGADVKIPDKLKVPDGHRLVLRVEAEGVQVYVSKPGKGGKPEWSFKSPLADLSKDGKVVGYHYVGPSWELLDGSKVVKDESQAPVDLPMPDSIPWLRIKVRPDPAQGGLGQVTYVLRVNTQGGLAPANPPTRSETEVGVKYKATYLFYAPAK